MTFSRTFEKFLQGLLGKRGFREDKITYEHMLTVLESLKVEEDVGRLSVKASFDCSHYGFLYPIEKTKQMKDVLTYVHIFRPGSVEPQIHRKEYSGKKNTKYILSMEKVGTLKGRLEILVLGNK